VLEATVLLRVELDVCAEVELEVCATVELEVCVPVELAVGAIEEFMKISTTALTEPVYPPTKKAPLGVELPFSV
jgi:hypothetical protein